MRVCDICKRNLAVNTPENQNCIIIDMFEGTQFKGRVARRYDFCDKCVKEIEKHIKFIKE